VTPSALLILAQKGFVAHRLAPLFCAQPARSARDRCLESLRRLLPCGCG
jgi:hypothetical protein